MRSPCAEFNFFFSFLFSSFFFSFFTPLSDFSLVFTFWLTSWFLTDKVLTVNMFVTDYMVKLYLRLKDTWGGQVLIIQASLFLPRSSFTKDINTNRNTEFEPFSFHRLSRPVI